MSDDIRVGIIGLDVSVATRALSLPIDTDMRSVSPSSLRDDATAINSALAEIAALKAANAKMLTALKKFVARCDSGEIKSRKTYGEFKEIIAEMKKV